MRLAVIIPAHNEETLLPRTLAALRAAADQSLANPAAGLASAEVVVVDDSSTDRTAPLAEAAGARVIRIERRQIAAARNAGARAAATADALVFVDADTVVPAEVLREALDALRAGAAGGGAFPRFDGTIPRYARIILPPFIALLRLSRATGGCFLFCTRAAYEASGGFDEALFASEELSFCRNLRKRAGRFVILRGRVVTSARKLRTHSGWEVLGFFLRFAFRPWRLKQREHLDIWYGPRRADPEGPAPTLP